MAGDFRWNNDMSNNRNRTDRLLNKVNILYNHLGLGKQVPPPATGDHADDFKANEDRFHYRRGFEDGYKKLIERIYVAGITDEQKVELADIMMTKILDELGAYYHDDYGNPFRRINISW